MSGIPVARLALGAVGFNALNIRTVTLRFQRSPRLPNGDVRGIRALSFQVLKNGAVIQNGTTGADGVIRMRIVGGVSTLQLISGGTPAEYTVRIRDDAIEDVATAAGQQRRLRMLGYQIGHTGPEGNGVDGAAVPTTTIDRTLLEFQVDGDIDPAGIADAGTQAALRAAVGGL